MGDKFVAPTVQASVRNGLLRLQNFATLSSLCTYVPFPHPCPFPDVFWGEWASAHRLDFEGVYAFVSFQQIAFKLGNLTTVIKRRSFQRSRRIFVYLLSMSKVQINRKGLLKTILIQNCYWKARCIVGSAQMANSRLSFSVAGCDVLKSPKKGPVSSFWWFAENRLTD